MLEILFLVWFCRKLAGMARDKNRSGSWGALGAILWIGGEVGGLAYGFSKPYSSQGSVYGYAILFAVVGAVVAYIIVATLKPIPRDGELPTARVV